MRKTFIPAALALSVLCLPLSACADEEVKSVKWYKAPENKQALDAKLKQCLDNPELQQKDQNCQNAADASVLSGSFKKVKEPAIPTF